jgi:hypothetical protein
VEQPAYYSSHEEDRDENGHERNRHCDNREPNLSRSLQSRVLRRHSVLDMAEDVFTHNNRIIYNQADRQSQREQRETVDRETESVERQETCQYRDGYRDNGNEGGSNAADKKEQGCKNADTGQQERELEVRDALLNCNRAVVDNVNRPGGSKLFSDSGQLELHAIS